MRDIAIFIIIMGLIPFCFTRPFIGVLSWSWLGYMNPHKLTWGFSYDFPFAQLIAIATLSGFIVMHLRKGEKYSLPITRETVLLILLWVFFTITTAFSLRPDWAWPELFKISKTLLMTFSFDMVCNFDYITYFEWKKRPIALSRQHGQKSVQSDTNNRCLHLMTWKCLFLLFLSSF